MKHIKRQCLHVLEDGTRCTHHKFNKKTLYCMFHRKLYTSIPEKPKPFKTKKVFIDYAEYIASPEWREKSRLAKQRAGNRCQLCNRSSKEITLHTHHRTYDRLGNEANSDLTVLCADCHEIFEFTTKNRPSKSKITN